MTSQAVFRLIESGDVFVGALHGEIDVANASDVTNEIVTTVTNEPRALVLDVSGVTYLDSSGLGMLFGLKRSLAARRQRFLLVLPPASSLHRLFRIAKVDAVIPVVSSLDRARSAAMATDADTAVT